MGLTTDDTRSTNALLEEVWLVTDISNKLLEGVELTTDNIGSLLEEVWLVTDKTRLLSTLFEAVGLSMLEVLITPTELLLKATLTVGTDKRVSL